MYLMIAAIFIWLSFMSPDLGLTKKKKFCLGFVSFIVQMNISNFFSWALSYYSHFAVKHNLYKLTLESRCDLFEVYKKEREKNANVAQTLIIFSSPFALLRRRRNRQYVHCDFALEFYFPLHAHKKQESFNSKRRAREKIANAWMGRIFFCDQFLHFLKCISRYIYVAAFGPFIYMHIVIIIFFIFFIHGNGFLFLLAKKKAHTMHNGGRMMKILKLRSFILFLSAWCI